MKAKLLNQCVCLLACWFLCFVHHLFHGFVIVKGTHGLETQFRNILWWSNLRLRSKICFTWSMGFERKIIVLKLFVANWEDPDFVSAVGLPTALFEASRAFKGPKGLWNRWWKISCCESVAFGVVINPKAKHIGDLGVLNCNLGFWMFFFDWHLR